MQIKHEIIDYGYNEKVWVGKYRNSQNLPHWHYDCELLLVEKGKVDVICDKKTYALAENQAFFIDSEQLHSIHAETDDSVLITIFFKFDLIKQFADKLALSSPLLSSDYNISRLYNNLINEFKIKEAFYELSTAFKISALMLDIYRNEITVPRQKLKQTTQSFKKLLSLMSENYEFFSFESAAEYMRMNPAYFSRFFHKLTGMTFSRYLNFIRVNKAINLLHSENNMPITEIAMLCGFSTIRSFNRIFKEMTGFTPTNLPADFILDETFSRSGSSFGNPTLNGCELIESSSTIY